MPRVAKVITKAKSAPTTPKKPKQDPNTKERDTSDSDNSSVLGVESLGGIFDTPQTAIKDKTLPKGTKTGKQPVSPVLEALDLASSPTPTNLKKGAFGKNVKEVDEKVSKVYKLIQKKTGTLGGNGYNGAIYGELTVGSMQKVIDIMKEKCEMNHTSRFIDVGAGLGKPNFHAAQDPAVRLSLGIELEDIRYKLSMHNLRYILPHVTSSGPSSENAAPEAGLLGGVNFIVNDIDEAHSTDPFTHIYMYDLGFPPELQKSIARKFNSSVHAEYLVSYRPPRRVINEYLYSVEFLESCPTSMHGSGEGHTAYFYKRIPSPTPSRPLPHQKQLTIPARPTSGLFNKNEQEQVVTCDSIFYEASKLALNNSTALLCAHTDKVVAEHMAAERPSRTRVPRVFYDNSS